MIMKKTTNYYGKSLLFAFAFSALFLFQNCSEDNSDSNTTNNAVKKETLSKDSKASKAAATTTATLSSLVTASGPDYIQAGTTLFNWTYTGNLPNVDLDSAMWWYTKVNNNGELPYVIAWGDPGIFMSVPDTYYSDTGNQTSNFVIYLTIRDTNGNLYRSPNYSIMKKGKFKLEYAL